MPRLYMIFAAVAHSLDILPKGKYLIMKTLREYMDKLDEISRRDFLKGAGAAAIAGAAGGAKADWEKDDVTDRMSDEVTKRYKNVSTNGEATLQYFPKDGQLTLLRSGGYWKPSDGIGQTPDFGRIRIDNHPVRNIRFMYVRGPANMVSIVGMEGSFGRWASADFHTMLKELLNAQSRILIDTSNIGGDILQFNPNVKENLEQEVAEQVGPDAVQKVEDLFRNK